MKAKINNLDTIEFSPKENTPLQGEDFNVKIISKEDRTLRISSNGKKYEARLLSVDAEAKKVNLKINGNRFQIELTDQYDDLLKSMGMGVGVVQKVNELKAPMPGIVFEIKVKIGDKIEKNGALIVLEAMKMENILKSPIDATIKSILVEKGDTVEKNKVLIEFE